MTIKTIYPRSRPATIYNVINGRPELPVSSTFSRGSTATYIDATGLMQTAANDVPRFNYNPYTNEFLGLLLEEENTNAWPYALFQTYSGSNSASSSQDMGPLGTVNAVFLDNVTDPTDGGYATNSATYYADGVEVTVSIYVKSTQGKPRIYGATYDSGNPWDFLLVYRDSYIDGDKAIVEQVAEDVWQFTITVIGSTGTYGTSGVYRLQPDQGYSSSTTRPMWFSGMQIEEGASRSSLIMSNSGPTTRQADNFSLIGTGNFDSGFSLLLDSETQTTTFIYKIFDTSDDQIVALNNDNGTLDWTIGIPPSDVSAQKNGDYPLVGFRKGRVRTISSLGKADGTAKGNYLYTTGLSFPTNAIVPPNASYITFGVPQTLKALYVWRGQLQGDQAVALIKGDENIVPNIAINADSYSFVYNTDPNNVGAVDVELPGIVPTAVTNGMQINWGDSAAYEQYNKGVTPKHTYPYPGQYRIQITAASGLDSVQLGFSTNKRTITKLDQWLPPYRSGQTPGYTGDDLVQILYYQSVPDIPVFAYDSNLTDLSYAFANCSYTNSDGWDWVPRNLPNATTLAGTFSYLSQVPIDGDTSERNVFPQLNTSDKLTSVYACFNGTPLTGWLRSDNVATLFPWSNTTKVSEFSYALANSSITQIGALVTNEAINIVSMFENTPITSLPSMNFDKVQNNSSAFANCKQLTAFPAIDFPACITYQSTWQGCDNASFTTFPNIDISAGKQFINTWNGCTKIESFPTTLDFSSAESINSAWLGCSGLTSFPAYDFPEVTDAKWAWRSCRSVATNWASTGFGKVILPKCTNFTYTWFDCGFTDFPDIDFPEGLNFNGTWSANSFVTFPTSTNKYVKGTNFESAWNGCTSLTTFPSNEFENTGTLVATGFRDAFKNCALSKDSIQNILTSLTYNSRKGVNENIELGIQGGTNQPRYTGSSGTNLNWSVTAENAFTELIGDGWTITYNKYTGTEDTLPAAFRIFHGPNAIHFITDQCAVESGQPNQESFSDEGEAVARVLELDSTYFPEWDRDGFYPIGSLVKFGTCIFRALQENDASDFTLPNLDLEPNAEIATPMNRQARWQMVCNPEFE